MKRFTELVAEAAERVKELFPWDLEEIMQEREIMLLDVREPYEYEAMHIEGSINVPRSVLETACEYDYEETQPELVEGILYRGTRRMRQESEETMRLVREAMGMMRLDELPRPREHSGLAPGLIYC